MVYRINYYRRVVDKIVYEQITKLYDFLGTYEPLVPISERVIDIKERSIQRKKSVVLIFPVFVHLASKWANKGNSESLRFAISSTNTIIEQVCRREQRAEAQALRQKF